MSLIVHKGLQIEGPAARQAMVARQPICERNQHTIAYELLFRNAASSAAAVIDSPDGATAQVIVNSFMDIGMDRMVGRSVAFINVTRDFILGNHCQSLPKERVVFEILEDTQPDAKLLASLESHIKAGYRFALDDYTFQERLFPLLPYCSYVKVDVRQTDRRNVASQLSALKRLSAMLLAEKVETMEEFEFYRQAGFDCFQGYFFCKPKLFSGSKISPNRVAVCRLLARLHNPDATTRDIEVIVSEDLTLSYQLLRYINSAAVPLPRMIESVGQAVRLVGTEHIRLLASLMMLTRLEDKAPELVTTSLVRARTCELLARRFGTAKVDASFTVGLFSTLDAFLNCSMEQALELVPISDAVRAALVSYEGELGQVLKCVRSYENGDWEALDNLHTDGNLVAESYLQAVEFSDNVINHLSSSPDTGA